MISKKLTIPLLLASCFSLHAEKHLFDGKTLNGWDGNVESDSPYYIYSIFGTTTNADIEITKSGTFVIIK